MTNRPDLLEPRVLLRELMDREPSELETLPRDLNGIYALHDHTEVIRYIGITRDDPSGFFGRINNRHVCGSEGRSHKFSHAYNTGRMWREKRDQRPDARLAKALRASFARRYCRAVYLPLPPLRLDELRKLEKAVQTMAPATMMDWGNKRSFQPVPEPIELVDRLLDELRYSEEQREAVIRQARRAASSRCGSGAQA